MDIIIIAALDPNRVIGKDNTLPWNISEDLQHFKNATKGNTIVMGRKTYESIGQPLPHRNNIVISTTMDNQLDFDVCGTIKNGLLKAKTYGRPVFIVGGASIYEQALPSANKMYLSHVKKEYEGDTYFPEWNKDEWEVVRREDHEEFTLVIYERKQHDTR